MILLKLIVASEPISSDFLDSKLEMQSFDYNYSSK